MQTVVNGNIKFLQLTFILLGIEGQKDAFCVFKCVLLFHNWEKSNCICFLITFSSQFRCQDVYQVYFKMAYIVFHTIFWANNQRTVLRGTLRIQRGAYSISLPYDFVLYKVQLMSHFFPNHNSPPALSSYVFALDL